MSAAIPTAPLVGDWPSSISTMLINGLPSWGTIICANCSIGRCPVAFGVAGTLSATVTAVASDAGRRMLMPLSRSNRLTAGVPIVGASERAAVCTLSSSAVGSGETTVAGAGASSAGAASAEDSSATGSSVIEVGVAGSAVSGTTSAVSASSATGNAASSGASVANGCAGSSNAPVTASACGCGGCAGSVLIDSSSAASGSIGASAKGFGNTGSSASRPVMPLLVASAGVSSELA